MCVWTAREEEPNVSATRKSGKTTARFRRLPDNEAPCVLLVDDDQDVHAQVSSILEQARWRVRGCTGPEQALDLCRRRRFDLLLVSFLFEVTTARDLLAELHRSLPLEKIPPILILNGLGGILGFDSFRDYPRVKAMLAKPLDAKALLATARKMLAQEQRVTAGGAG